MRFAPPSRRVDPPAQGSKRPAAYGRRSLRSDGAPSASQLPVPLWWRCLETIQRARRKLFRQPPRRAVATDRPPASAPKAEASHGLSRTLSDTACRSRIRRCSQRRSRATQTRAWFSVAHASFAVSPDRAYVGGQAARSTGMRSRLEGSLHGKAKKELKLVSISSE